MGIFIISSGGVDFANDYQQLVVLHMFLVRPISDYGPQRRAFLSGAQPPSRRKTMVLLLCDMCLNGKNNIIYIDILMNVNSKS